MQQLLPDLQLQNWTLHTWTGSPMTRSDPSYRLCSPSVCVCVCVCVWYAPFCDALKLSRVTFLIDFYDRHMGVRAVDLPTLLSVQRPPRLPGRQAELRDTSGNLLLSDKILQSVVSVRLCLSNKPTSDVNVFACVSCMGKAVKYSHFSTLGEVTLQSLWSRYDRHFVGITRYNALS